MTQQDDITQRVRDNKTNIALAAKEWATPENVQAFPMTACAHIAGLADALLSKLRAPVADERAALQRIVNTAKDGANSGDRHARCVEIARAALASAPVAGEAVSDDIERMAVNRYRPVPDSVFGYKVVAGDGNRSLHTGTKEACYLVARKLTEAFLDGAFVASNAAPQASEAVRDPVAQVFEDLLMHGIAIQRIAPAEFLAAQADKDGGDCAKGAGDAK